MTCSKQVRTCWMPKLFLIRAVLGLILHTLPGHGFDNNSWHIQPVYTCMGQLHTSYIWTPVICILFHLGSDKVLVEASHLGLAMPRAITFQADLAGALEDSKEVREIFRSRRSLLAWKDNSVQGLPSLAALGFNSRVMCIFAEVYTSACSKVKAPPVGWIRKEVAVRAKLFVQDCGFRRLTHTKSVLAPARSIASRIS